MNPHNENTTTEPLGIDKKQFLVYTVADVAAGVHHIRCFDLF